MAATKEQLDAFASLTWATTFVTSPNWVVEPRHRVEPEVASDSTTIDQFCNTTMRLNEGVAVWVEAFEQPASRTDVVTHSLSLIHFGKGLNGLPGIAHGGALLTLMDEAAGYMMITNEKRISGGTMNDLGTADWRKLLAEGRSPSEFLKGRLLTAKMATRFLRPVVAPGIVGIEVKMVENTGDRMVIKATMKGADGKPVMIADSTWIKIGAKAKM